MQSATLAAFVILLCAALGLDVNFQLRCGFELLSAFGTHIVLAVTSFMFLLNVFDVVCLQGKLSLADAAPEDAVLVAFVLVAVPLGSEWSLAQGANESSRWIVPFGMAQIVGFVEENLIANIASIMDTIHVVIGRLFGFPRQGILLGFRWTAALSFHR